LTLHLPLPLVRQLTSSFTPWPPFDALCAGDIAAEQPKAAGSSLLAKLAHLLAADALELAGMREVGQALVVPLATGMAITTVLLALRGLRPASARCLAGCLGGVDCVESG
jgi:hypothetical protein